MNSITVQQAKALKATLEEKIVELLTEFSKETDLTVERIDITTTVYGVGGRNYIVEVEAQLQ